METFDYAARMSRAVAAAEAAGLDGLLVSPGPDLTWLTGYQPPAETERLTLLILTRSHAPVLIVPALEALSAVGPVPLLEWRDGSDPYALAAGLLAADGQYGVSDSTWALHLLGLMGARPGTGYRGLSDALPMLRAVKDPVEVSLLSAAGAAADEAYSAIRSVPFAGRRELDIAASLAQLLRDFGHSTVDFTIVASGPNGADPHHAAGTRIISSGDAVVLDFGGLMGGYGSDTTRTVVVDSPSPRLREVHEVVRQAQEAAFAAVRPGVSCQEIDRVARRVITSAGYGERFIHRTGHGIGVTTHEPPYLVEGEERLLVPGMCFSIEPGVYLPGQFGVRIEDIVTVTPSGGRRLNNTDRGLAVVH
ncbi:aminopeptidase P family protein [Actinoplanes sp. NPDC051411]|uniref:M24 family metallopeptidase n=1 Tax=Actinoplanes sp. NPDC051411 TaxID=3155522 RepID=UPI003436857E